MNIDFIAKDSINLSIEEEKIPLSHYLQHPQRVIQAIANTSPLESLSETHFRLKISPLNFLDLYQFQPIVLIKAWSSPHGHFYIHSEDCHLQGLELFQDRFTFTLKGLLESSLNPEKTALKGQVKLSISIDLPPPLLLTPYPLLQQAGNTLLASILAGIKNRLGQYLLTDYYHWSNLK